MRLFVSCKALTSSALFLVVATVSQYGYSGEDALHSLEECPSTSQLNATTMYWHLQKKEERVFRDAEYAGIRVKSGLEDYYAKDEVRELNPETELGICKKLNEKYLGRHLMTVPDRELGREVPEVYSIYYRAKDRIVVVTSVYSPGEPELGRVGLPSGGVTGVHVYDQKLNLIGKFSL